MMGLVPLQNEEEIPKRLISLPCGHSNKLGTICELGSGSSQDANHAGSPVLDFPDS